MISQIYAHRGVDLVVAYMGVLKAGATVSVVEYDLDIRLYGLLDASS